MTIYDTLDEALTAAQLYARGEVRQIGASAYVACVEGETLIGRLVWPVDENRA